MSGAKLEALAPQRLQVNAAIATVQLAYGGQLIVETTDLTALAFKGCLIVVHAPLIGTNQLRPQSLSPDGACSFDCECTAAFAPLSCDNSALPFKVYPIVVHAPTNCKCDAAAAQLSVDLGALLCKVCDLVVCAPSSYTISLGL